MYIQLRITPEFCGEPVFFKSKKLVIQELCDYFKQFGDILNIAACEESLNKFGETTSTHWHVNLVLDDHIRDFKKDSFQAWFRRRKYLPKGNKCYAIAIVGDPDDEDRWWRYLLKETDAPFVTDFPEEFKANFEVQVAMAQDERKLQIERNIAARERALQNDSFRLKCYSSILEMFNSRDPASLNDRMIYCEIMRYYQANNKIPPFNTGMNMVIDFKVHVGLMTIEDYYDTRFSTDNSFSYNII